MYLIDASALIFAKNHHYQFDRVPPFWEWLHHHAREGTIKMPQEIFDEILRQDDELKAWVKDIKDDILVDADDYDTRVGEVLDCYGGAENLTPSDLHKIGGDPYLVACALHLNASVITEEVSKKTQTGVKRKIPDTCDILGVEWVDIGGIQKRPGIIDILDFKINWK